MFFFLGELDWSPSCNSDRDTKVVSYGEGSAFQFRTGRMDAVFVLKPRELNNDGTFSLGGMPSNAMGSFNIIRVNADRKMVTTDFKSLSL